MPDMNIPLAAAGTSTPHWALLNLLLAVSTCIMMLIMFFTYFTGRKRHKEDETCDCGEIDCDCDFERAFIKEYKELEEEHIIKRRGFVRILSIIPALAAVITFILTEDMSNPMIWADKWTGLMLIIAIVQVVVAYWSIKKHYYVELPDDFDLEDMEPTAEVKGM